MVCMQGPEKLNRVQPTFSFYFSRVEKMWWNSSGDHDSAFHFLLLFQLFFHFCCIGFYCLHCITEKGTSEFGILRTVFGGMFSLQTRVGRRAPGIDCYKRQQQTAAEGDRRQDPVYAVIIRGKHLGRWNGHPDPRLFQDTVWRNCQKAKGLFGFCWAALTDHFILNTKTREMQTVAFARLDTSGDQSHLAFLLFHPIKSAKEAVIAFVGSYLYC